jgi:hypothetical protein
MTRDSIVLMYLEGIKTYVLSSHILMSRLYRSFFSIFRRLTIQRHFTMSATPLEAVNEFCPITEGKATILFPNTNEVFYNPVQQFNR